MQLVPMSIIYTKKRQICWKQLSSICRICQRVFRSVGELNGHIRTHAVKQETGTATAFEDDGRKETLVHTKNLKKPFKCKLCLATFDNATSLQLHAFSHTKLRNFDGGKFIRGKKYKCRLCTETFDHVDSYLSHAKIHRIGKKPYKCSFCPKAYKNSDRLDLHTRVHTGEKAYTCEVCAMEFTQKACLDVHMILHTGEKFFMCTICDKTFTESIYLHAHVRTHTEEILYKCEICEKVFLKRRNLIRHVTAHTEYKPLKCNLCGTVFAQNVDLGRHACEKLSQSDLCHKDGNTSCKALNLDLQCYDEDRESMTGFINSGPVAKLHIPGHTLSTAYLNPFKVSFYGCGLCDAMFDCDVEFLEHCCLHWNIPETETFIDIIEGLL